jgi:hypothetical protein
LLVIPAKAGIQRLQRYVANDKALHVRLREGKRVRVTSDEDAGLSGKTLRITQKSLDPRLRGDDGPRDEGLRDDGLVDDDLRDDGLMDHGRLDVRHPTPTHI